MRSLKLREEQVEIAGRVFWLREQTGEEFERYLELQAAPYRQAVEGCLKREGEGLLELACSLVLQSEEFFVWLLSEPGDGLAPPDRAWVRDNVSTRMRRELLRIQDELNDLKDLLGKLKDLLTLAAAEQQVEKNQHLLAEMSSPSGSSSAASSADTTTSTP